MREHLDVRGFLRTPKPLIYSLKECATRFFANAGFVPCLNQKRYPWEFRRTCLFTSKCDTFGLGSDATAGDGAQEMWVKFSKGCDKFSRNAAAGKVVIEQEVRGRAFCGGKQ